MSHEFESRLPYFVEKEFSEYLKCGILAHGFLRAKCEGCYKEKLMAFSCKRRGFCPSCGAKRMTESSVHLTEKVFPFKPVRQWVLSFPYQLRYLFAEKPAVMASALTIVNRAISKFIINKSGFKKNEATTGAVTLVQRFGGSLNLNIHFHMLYLDGAFKFNDEKIQFSIIDKFKQSELQQLLHKIVKNLTRFLLKKGLLTKDDESEYFTLDDPDGYQRLKGASITYRIAMGKNKGKKALTLQTVPISASSFGSKYLAKESGFSLHAGLTVVAQDRKKLERICRYITRPAISEDRLRINAQGNVVYSLKKNYDDGTTHIVLEPIDFLSRLAALVPKPRVHLIRFHGVFAPNFKLRKKVVPTSSVDEASKEKQLELKQLVPVKMTWAQRLKRVFAIDITKCDSCGGKVKIIATVEKKLIIKKILNHLGLESEPPELHPTRGPPVPGDNLAVKEDCQYHYSEH